MRNLGGDIQATTDAADIRSLLRRPPKRFAFGNAHAVNRPRASRNASDCEARLMRAAQAPLLRPVIFHAAERNAGKVVREKTRNDPSKTNVSVTLEKSELNEQVQPRNTSRIVRVETRMSSIQPPEFSNRKKRRAARENLDAR